MRLILIRHGRSTANAEGILAGRTPDVALDERGVRQAEQLAMQLADVNVAATYCSPLLRCQQTAMHAGLTATRIMDGLNECDYGEWTGARLKDLADQALWRTIQETPSKVTFPGGESMADMAQRAVGAITELARRHKGKTVVAVSHGDPIKAILADALGMEFDKFQRIHVAPASVSIIDYSGAAPFVLAVNGTSAALTQLATTGPQVGGGDVAKQ